MSFGALGANAKEALGRAATAMGTSTTTGDGGMTDEERRASKLLVYQVLPSRYGLNRTTCGGRTRSSSPAISRYRPRGRATAPWR